MDARPFPAFLLLTTAADGIIDADLKGVLYFRGFWRHYPEKGAAPDGGNGPFD